MSAGTMAITMAGFGNRFREAGYNLPKYRIEALGRPLFDWSMLSLSAFAEAGWRFAFAVQRDDRQEDFIRERCAALGLAVEDLLALDAPTDGQATTARMLAETAPPNAPFAVYNIDTFVRPGAMTPPDEAALSGWIPCFPGRGEGWSFARLGTDGTVVELREKTRISPHATLGLYWFKSARAFLDLYDKHFATSAEEKGERYVAPMYNTLIDAGRTVRIAHVALGDVGMLGTPDQVRTFVAEPPDAARALALP